MAVSEVQDKVCGPPAGQTFSSLSSTITGLSGKEATVSSERETTSKEETVQELQQ
jgi:hypothetical protein